MKEEKYHSELSANTKAIIDNISASLSKKAVDRFSKLLPSHDTSTDGSEDHIKSKLDAALQRFFNHSKDSFIEDKRAELTSMLTTIANDIVDNGFFNPRSIADSDINQMVAAFIQFINDPILLSPVTSPIEPIINDSSSDSVSTKRFPNTYANRPLNNTQNRLISAVSCMTVCALALCYSSGMLPVLSILNLKMILLILIQPKCLKMHLLIINKVNLLKIIKKSYTLFLLL